MVGRASRRRRRRAVDPQRAQVKFVDEHVDHPHGVFLGHVVVQAIGEQRRLPAVVTLDQVAQIHLPTATSGF